MSREDVDIDAVQASKIDVCQGDLVQSSHSNAEIDATIQATRERVIQALQFTGEHIVQALVSPFPYELDCVVGSDMSVPDASSQPALPAGALFSDPSSENKKNKEDSVKNREQKVIFGQVEQHNADDDCGKASELNNFINQIMNQEIYFFTIDEFTCFRLNLMILSDFLMRNVPFEGHAGELNRKFIMIFNSLRQLCISENTKLICYEGIGQEGDINGYSRFQFGLIAYNDEQKQILSKAHGLYVALMNFLINDNHTPGLGLLMEQFILKQFVDNDLLDRVYQKKLLFPGMETNDLEEKIKSDEEFSDWSADREKGIYRMALDSLPDKSLINNSLSSGHGAIFFNNFGRVGRLNGTRIPSFDVVTGWMDKNGESTTTHTVFNRHKQRMEESFGVVYADDVEDNKDCREVEPCEIEDFLKFEH